MRAFSSFLSAGLIHLGELNLCDVRGAPVLRLVLLLSHVIHRHSSHDPGRCCTGLVHCRSCCLLSFCLLYNNSSCWFVSVTDKGFGE